MTRDELVDAFPDLTYKAVIHEAPEGTEIIGMSLMGLFDSQESALIDPILEHYNLRKENVDPEQWYPLAAFYELQDGLGLVPDYTSADVASGKAIMADMIRVFEVRDLETFLNGGWNAMTHQLVRHAPADFGYPVKQVGERHYLILNNTSSSNYFVYGALWEAARLLRPIGSDFSLKVVQNLMSEREGAIFELKWDADDKRLGRRLPR